MQAGVVIRTSKMKISCCRLADHVKKLHQKMCCKVIFHHSTSQKIDLWCSRCCCHYYFFNSLSMKGEAATSCVGYVAQSEQSELLLASHKWVSYKGKECRLALSLEPQK